MKLRLLLGACAVLGVAMFASTASAEPIPVPPYVCTDPGTALSGTYGNLTVTGNAYVGFGETLTVKGNLTIAPGGCLDALFRTEAVTVTGNVKVGKGAILALGYNAEEGTLGPDVVGGNIVANDPLSVYLGGATVHGNFVSNGGGDPGRNFPIKDNVIGGNLIIQGWHGLWMGAIRNTVGGNVIISRNTAADPSTLPGSDSTEIQTNVISGNLICFGNTPGAVVNVFDGGQPNVVGGNAIGECADLTT